MDFAARVLANPYTVIWLVIALIALAVTFSWKFRIVLREAQKPLQEAAQLLQTIPSRSDFTLQYLDIANRISALFHSSRSLTQQWQRYQAQLSRTDEGTVCSYRPAEEFFHSTPLLKDRWLPLCKAGPNYLVGIGLVFTFLGIAVVIYRASLALGSSNDLQALRALLGAAAMKFWTSLAGVALSVMTSGYFRQRMADYQVTVSDFAYELSIRVPVLSQEYSLHASTGYLAKQLEATHTLRLALLAQGEQNSRAIVKELQALQEKLISVTQRAFSELVEKSTTELSAAITSSLKEVAQTFTTINEDVRQVLAQLQTLPENFRSLSSEVNRSVQEVSKQLQGASQTLVDELFKTKAFAGEIATEFATSTDFAHQIRHSLETLPSTLDKVTEGLNRLAELQHVSQRLQEAATAMRSSSDALIVNWKQQADHISSVDEKLAHTVTTLPSVFTQYAESLQKFTDDFDDHLGRVLGSLANQVESLDASQGSLRQIAETLHASANHQSHTRTAESL